MKKVTFKRLHAIAIAAFLLMIIALVPHTVQAQAKTNVLVMGSTDKYHAGSVAKGRDFFAKLAADNNLNLRFTQDTSLINDDTLANYQVFVQLHLAPFDMSGNQQQALQRFVMQGKAWVGIHAAGLTGKQFHAGDLYWQWFEDAMGGVVYSPHPKFQQGTLVIEDRAHSATRNMPPILVMTDEWYEFDKSPRPNVRVLAHADESTYHQNKPMGDHPLVWVNEKYRRFIYIGIGHDSSAYDNPPYALLLRDAILWAGAKGDGKNTALPGIKQDGVLAKTQKR